MAKALPEDVKALDMVKDMAQEARRCHVCLHKYALYGKPSVYQHLTPPHGQAVKSLSQGDLGAPVEAWKMLQQGLGSEESGRLDHKKHIHRCWSSALTTMQT